MSALAPKADSPHGTFVEVAPKANIRRDPSRLIVAERYKRPRNEPRLWGLLRIADGGDHAWLSMGHGHVMTIADYIAFGVLIALALSAVVVMYARQSRVKQN